MSALAEFPFYKHWKRLILGDSARRYLLAWLAVFLTVGVIVLQRAASGDKHSCGSERYLEIQTSVNPGYQISFFGDQFELNDYQLPILSNQNMVAEGLASVAVEPPVTRTRLSSDGSWVDLAQPTREKSVS